MGDDRKADGAGRQWGSFAPLLPKKTRKGKEERRERGRGTGERGTDGKGGKGGGRKGTRRNEEEQAGRKGTGGNGKECGGTDGKGRERPARTENAERAGMEVVKGSVKEGGKEALRETNFPVPPVSF